MFWFRPPLDTLHILGKTRDHRWVACGSCDKGIDHVVWYNTIWCVWRQGGSMFNWVCWWKGHIERSLSLSPCLSPSIFQFQQMFIYVHLLGSDVICRTVAYPVPMEYHGNPWGPWTNPLCSSGTMAPNPNGAPAVSGRKVQPIFPAPSLGLNGKPYVYYIIGKSSMDYLSLLFDDLDGFQNFQKCENIKYHSGPVIITQDSMFNTWNLHLSDFTCFWTELTCKPDSRNEGHLVSGNIIPLNLFADDKLRQIFNSGRH